jgi:hypothetical protein
MNQSPKIKTKGKVIKIIALCSIPAVIFYAVVWGLKYDMIVTNYLAKQICEAEPNPKTFIKKTVDYPESIYWEDNIYPGFDEQDRLLMIRNYLDGVHLKTMALNGPDGTIYLFTATHEDWKASRAIHDGKIKANYFATMENEAKNIAKRGVTISQQEASLLNFQVVFNPVQLTAFQRRYLYSDAAVITENKTNEVIGYNRRLMRKFYLLQPDFVGNRYYYPEAMCGFSPVIGFINKVLSYANNINPGISMDFDSTLYRKIKDNNK